MCLRILVLQFGESHQGINNNSFFIFTKYKKEIQFEQLATSTIHLISLCGLDKKFDFQLQPGFVCDATKQLASCFKKKMNTDIIGNAIIIIGWLVEKTGKKTAIPWRFIKLELNKFSDPLNWNYIAVNAQLK